MKAGQPNIAQARVLRRIAQTGGMMLTRQDDKPDSYSDLAGVPIRKNTAERCISAGWVIANTDSMFDLKPQTWRARTVRD
jgi:hypothetical protein